ncbi:non-functional NADPH-dependent codeinone reductase 2-like [Iris pallida]|uniref:Non-functional NADPH-dependent codeinone reductase 2-like n=1 Tax=Iris pallida TaxID=29817 RepID=A0AAX6IBB1_IRIPA|nr:non-functional NADPH-dependent codeinone reductase 2-like [Iris pallida]
MVGTRDINTRLDIAHDEVVEKVFKHQSSYIQGLGAYARPTTFAHPEPLRQMVG